MRKTLGVATVVAVLGIGVIGYSLIRTSGQIGRIDPEKPAPLDAAVREEPRTTETGSAPVATAAPAEGGVAEVTGEPRADELTADERSPFGHAGTEQIQPDHQTTTPEGPPTDAAGDATSLAPLLTDAHATLTQLLAEAEGDPEATAELAALLGSSAPLEALLEDPDPAVREEAAKLLDVLGSSTAQ
jgi:hypothetical protein